MHTAEDLKTAGDELQALLRRAVVALVDENTDELWRVLDVDAFKASNEWDRLRGRDYVTPEQIAEGRRNLVALARDAEAAVGNEAMDAVRCTSEGR